MKKISVIVPIYNTEKYLKKCVDSILSQGEELEILLINDGSTDQSGEIAKEYAVQYPKKVRYFQKENGGLSDSRNYGVEKATGEYLAFVDSDDYLAPGLFSHLISWMEQEVKVIKYKTIKVTQEGQELEKIEGPTFEPKIGEEAFEILFPQDVMIEAAWLYIIQRKFYQENNFAFPKGTYHEDFGLIPLIITRAKTVVSTKEYGYYYVQSEGSITRNNNYAKTVKRVQDMLIHYDTMLLWLKEQKLSQRAEENLKIYYTNALLLKATELKGKEQKEYFKELRRRKISKNIKVRNGKQLLKRIILTINMKAYLKIR